VNGICLIPSYNRPKRLSRFFESYFDTNSEIGGLVLVDACDPACIEYFNLKTPSAWSIYLTGGRSMGDKCREAWRAATLPHDAVILLNDDHVLRTLEWDKRLMDQLNGRNFISTSDGWRTNGKSTLPAGATAWSGPLLKAVGYIFPKGLNHMFIDNVWRDLGLATNCWQVDESIVVEHEHATRDQKFMDATHRQSESYHAADSARYMQWRNGGEFDEAVRKINELVRQAETSV
jgi:hypothetical protein